MTVFRFAGSVFSVALTFAATLAIAAEPEPLQRSNATAVWFENWGSLYNSTLTVVSPEGVQVSLFFAAGSPTFYLREFNPAADGVYQYELRAATTETVKVVNAIDQGRGSAEKSEIARPFYLSGAFTVSRGVITVPEVVVEN